MLPVMNFVGGCLLYTSGCLANCVLDYVAIFVLDWGVWGAAFATGLSQLLTCIIYLRHFLGGHNTFHFVKFRMDWSIYKRLIPLGFADGVTELCNGVMIFLFNRVILDVYKRQPRTWPRRRRRSMSAWDGPAHRCRQ